MELMQRRIRYSGDTFFKLYHLCYYFSRVSVNDENRKLVIDFKKAKEPAVRHFIVKALQFLEYREIDENLLVIRALHSRETTAEDELTPLDRLGDSLASVLDCSYYPKILRKTKVTQPIKSLTFPQRAAELKGVYRIDPNFFNLNHREVLIIDDVVTTGATSCAIIKSILDHFPEAKINVFALAWTPAPNQQLYIQEQISRGMMLNEPEPPYGTGAHKWVDEDFIKGETNISLYP